MRTRKKWVDQANAQEISEPVGEMKLDLFLWNLTARWMPAQEGSKGLTTHFNLKKRKTGKIQCFKMSIDIKSVSTPNFLRYNKFTAALLINREQNNWSLLHSPKECRQFFEIAAASCQHHVFFLKSPICQEGHPCHCGLLSPRTCNLQDCSSYQEWFLELYAPHSLATLEMFCTGTGLSLVPIGLEKATQILWQRSLKIKLPYSHCKCIVELLLFCCLLHSKNKVSAG